MRILVTGGAGYIGDCVVKNLFRVSPIRVKDLSITVVDNLTYTDSYMRPGVEFLNLDITDAVFWEWLDATEPFDVIIHLAAMVGDGACAASPEYTEVLNEKTLMWFRDHVNKKNPDCRFIFTSTCSVYGDNNSLLNEESETRPLSLYAGTKLNAEKYVNEIENSVIYRLGTLYGLSTEFARIRADLVANILTFKACQGQDLTVFGGEQWRPLIHVRDVGRAIAISAFLNERGTYILSRENYKIVDLAREVSEIVPGAGKLIVTDMKFEDLRNYKVDNTKMRDTGFSPLMTVSLGVKEMADALRSGRIKNPWISKYHNAKFIKESTSA